MMYATGITKTAGEKLKELLKGCSANGDNPSHVSMGHPFGSYQIGSKISNFLQLYQENYNNIQYYFAEKLMNEIPILVDVDLKIELSNSSFSSEMSPLTERPRPSPPKGSAVERTGARRKAPKVEPVAAPRPSSKAVEEVEFNMDRLYTDEQVKQLVEAYQTAITDHVNFEGYDEKQRRDAYTCVVLEKEPYKCVKGDVYYKKNGFHLHFPKLFLKQRDQVNFIIPKVKLLTKGLFHTDDAIDSAVLNNYWLLYGSAKQNMKPYIATYCYLYNAQRCSLEEGLNDYLVASFPGDEFINLNCQNRVQEMLPRILSTILYNRDTYHFTIKTSIESPLLTYDSGKIFKKLNKFDVKDVIELLKEAEVLLNMMDHKRADKWDSWYKIGCCLYKISKGDVNGFNLWSEFSMRSDKYDESECITIWQKMRENNYTIGTLKYFAKEDNPEEYKRYTREQNKKLVRAVIKGGHNDLAKILHSEHHCEYVCSSIKGKNWFQFKQHIWGGVELGTFLRAKISDENGAILSRLNEFKEEVYIQLARLRPQSQPTSARKKRAPVRKNTKKSAEKFEDDSDDSDDAYDTKPQDEQEELEFQEKVLNKIISSCKNATYKNSVMQEAQELFYNEGFLPLLNKNPYLIAFQNGVYDFSTNVFRDGHPEDFLSVALPIEYNESYTFDHPDVLDVISFFEKVFPDEQVREYFFYEVCQVFVGGNPSKIIQFWTGEGNNGKSVTQALFEKMLGPLAVKFSTSLLTGKKKDLGAAAPELARSGNGVRWAVMDEPSADEVINPGPLKCITGNDAFFARDLFQTGKETVEIIPMFKIVMICNQLPVIKDADKATWNRVRVIPFESTFVPLEECPTDVEEQFKQKKFPMDKHFTTTKLPKLLEPLAWYLIQRWTHIKNDSEYIEPLKVKVATAAYREDNDIYTQFELQCIIHKEGYTLPIATLHEIFEGWLKIEFPQLSQPARPAIRKAFRNMWGAPGKNGWENKTIKMEGDSEE
jgi:P4 family phage/plasmid primase-like protien